MIITMTPDATEADVSRVVNRLEELGYPGTIYRGGQQTLIHIVKGENPKNFEHISHFSGVSEILPSRPSFTLKASREAKSEDSIVIAGPHEIGGGSLTIIAGPCSVESREQLGNCAEQLVENGIGILRGGAFKPRTSPYSFQGLGEAGLKLLREVADQYNLLAATEVISEERVDLIADHVDMLWVGTRNMQNFSLIKALGKIEKPVILKRGFGATYSEWLHAAEYLLKEGNDQVILCERGIRGFGENQQTRLDISAIPIMKQMSHLPVMADPSHGSGDRNLVPALAKAAVAAGADALMMEIHPAPGRALSDRSQALLFEDFSRLVGELRSLHENVRSSRELFIP